MRRIMAWVFYAKYDGADVTLPSSSSYDPPVRVVFFGTPAFAATSLEAVLESSHRVVAVVAQPDRRAGRGMKTHRPETAVLAESRGVRTLQPSKIRTDEFLDEIRGADGADSTRR